MGRTHEGQSNTGNPVGPTTLTVGVAQPGESSAGYLGTLESPFCMFLRTGLESRLGVSSELLHIQLITKERIHSTQPTCPLRDSNRPDGFAISRTIRIRMGEGSTVERASLYQLLRKTGMSGNQARICAQSCRRGPPLELQRRKTQRSLNLHRRHPKRIQKVKHASRCTINADL